MLLIEHRVNTVDHLHRVPRSHGVEVDVRDSGGHLTLSHDPFEAGERLEDYLRSYEHAFIVFNMKCDGLEADVLALARARGISDFFLLDVAAPSLVRLARSGERRIAVRFSEFEPVESAMALAGLVDWAWIDCFTRFPLDPERHALLRRHFRLCLVSPELQRHPRSEVRAYRDLLATTPVDAVCSDVCDDWIAP